MKTKMALMLIAAAMALGACRREEASTGQAAEARWTRVCYRTAGSVILRLLQAFTQTILLIPLFA